MFKTLWNSLSSQKAAESGEEPAFDRDKLKMLADYFPIGMKLRYYPEYQREIVFDTIAGLPVHILVIHAVVAFAPLAALLAIGYAVRPAWRRVLRWPVALLAVATGDREQPRQRQELSL